MSRNIYMIARPATGGPVLTNQVQNPLFNGWNATQLMSLSVGSTNSVTISSAGSGAGKASFSPLTITKPTDSNSPLFLRYCAAGLHFDRVTLYVTKPPSTGAETVVEIYVLGLVFITGISNDVTFGDDVVTETITFAYGQLDHRVKTFSPAGALTGFVEITWDLTVNGNWIPGTLDGPG